MTLFFAHLMLEKVLKALVIKVTNKAPPWTHDLVKLANVAKIPLPPKLTQDLKEINTFNIKARYDDIKLQFYKKATRDYTKKYLNRCLEIYQWIKKKI